ncbi:MAG: hypothetical protein JOS17DRAFT_837592 [Linnemannia elongata]|nr:MAG: hypothetical protein JOS17DRAFT_837592 [Linnemannia elongata]
MYNKPLTLFCLIDGEATTNAFPVEIESIKTIGDLKDLIKANVSIPDDDNDDEIPIVFDNVNNNDKKKLRATRGLLEVFPDKAPKNIIHIIVQRPPQVHAPAPSRALTPSLALFLMVLVLAHRCLLSVHGPSGPLAPDSELRNLASSSILEMVKANNRPLIPVFGVSGCGKTRAVVELLSQYWGFYFNASSDDWGSSDMITLHSTVQGHLNHDRASFIVD